MTAWTQEVGQRREQLPRASVGLKAGIGQYKAMRCRFFPTEPPHRAMLSGEKRGEQPVECR